MTAGTTCCYGLVSDPLLLNRYHLTYQHNLEGWSQLLHGTTDRPTTQPTMPLQPMNLPQGILKAYFARKLQFLDMVEARGARFVWGVQPWVDSKRERSAAEQHYMDGLGDDHPWALVLKKVRFLYEKMAGQPLPERVRHVVDVHAALQTFGEDETLFGDFVHTTPRGDEVIADVYFPHVARWLEAA